MGETKRKSAKAAALPTKRASLPAALHSDKEVPVKPSTKRAPSAKAAPRRASVPATSAGPLPDPNSKVICGRNPSGSPVTTNTSATTAPTVAPASRHVSSRSRDRQASSSLPPPYLLEHITNDSSGTYSSNGALAQPRDSTTNDGGYFLFDDRSSIDTLSPVSQRTALRGRPPTDAHRAPQRATTEDTHPLSPEKISAEKLSLSTSSSQQTDSYFWTLAPPRSARRSAGAFAAPAAALAARQPSTAATPPPRSSMNNSTSASFESAVPYSMLQPLPYKRVGDSSFTAPAGASWRRLSAAVTTPTTTTTVDGAAAPEVGLSVRGQEVMAAALSGSARLRSSRVPSGTTRASKHGDDADVHRMPSVFGAPAGMGSQLPSFFRAPMSASRRTSRRHPRGSTGGPGESVLWNSVYSTSGRSTVAGNDTDSVFTTVAGWPQGGGSEPERIADAFSTERMVGATDGFPSFFVPNPGTTSPTRYSVGYSIDHRGRRSLQPHASTLSTALSVFNEPPPAFSDSSSSSSDDDADSSCGERGIVQRNRVAPDAGSTQETPRQKLSPWSSIYGVGTKSLVAMRAKRGSPKKPLARQTSLFVGAAQRGAEERESDRDTTSPSTVSRRRCTLDRKGTLNGAGWALETGKGRVHALKGKRHDASSSSDEDSSDTADDAVTQYTKRNFSFVLIPQQPTSASHRRSTVTDFLNDNDSVSSVDVIANHESSSSSSSDASDGEGDGRTVDEGHRTSLQRALAVMENFSEVSSDDDDDAHEGENEHGHDVHDHATGQASRPAPHTSPTPVPPMTAYEWQHNHGRRCTTTTTAVPAVPPHYPRLGPYQPRACSPQLPAMPRPQLPPHAYASPGTMPPYGVHQAWGAGNGVHAVAYLHAQCSTHSTSPKPYATEEVDDWQTQLADFTSPGLTAQSTATCNNSDVTESSPATSSPLQGGPPPVQFRTTVTALKVHELLGFDPETIRTVRSPRWRSLPRHR